MGVPTDSNPKTAFGITKPGLFAVPATALLHFGLAMWDGMRKYGLHNWRKSPVTASIYLDAMERHRLLYISGEDIDPKTGIHHLAYVGANAAILLDALETNNLIDDRPIPTEATARLIAQFEPVIKKLMAEPLPTVAPREEAADRA